MNRALYVDEQEVIRDGHPQLASSDRGLVIGGGAMSLPGTYFGGMIDDVRILRLSSGQVLQPSRKAVGGNIHVGLARFVGVVLPKGCPRHGKRRLSLTGNGTGQSAF